MRLGVATTILVGAGLILSGQIDFMLLFLFLLVITRVYAPFDQSLALIAEMFVSQVSADRMNEIYDTPYRRGGGAPSSPRATTLSLTMWALPTTRKSPGRCELHRQGGEVTALVGPSGSGKAPAPGWPPACGMSPGHHPGGRVDISTVDPEALLRDYSMVFQDVVLFDDTVMENIRLGSRGATDEEVRPRPRPPTARSLSAGCPRAMIPPSGRTAPSSPAGSGSASPSPGPF